MTEQAVIPRLEECRTTSSPFQKRLKIADNEPKN